MNAFVSALYRNLTCAAASAAITLALAASFVHATASAPGMHGAPAAAVIAVNAGVES